MMMSMVLLRMLELSVSFWRYIASSAILKTSRIVVSVLDFVAEPIETDKRMFSTFSMATER